MLVSRPARTTEIWPGQARLVKGEQIALFNVDSQFFALDNTCTHRGGPLADGEVTCPHGATFDVRMGEVVGPPGPTSRCAIHRSTDGNRLQGGASAAGTTPVEK